MTLMICAGRAGQRMPADPEEQLAGLRFLLMTGDMFPILPLLW